MSIKPILFNTEMVRANLDGRKKNTRRVMKGYALEHLEIDIDGAIIGVYDQNEGCVRPVMDFAPYQPGDILYVRETFRVDYLSNIPGTGRIHYKADNSFHDFTFLPERYEMMRRAQLKPGWRPNENMPKEAARLFLRVTDVRVERLQDIDDEGAKAEGANWHNGKNVGLEEKMRRSAVERFAEIWDSTIKLADLEKYGWNANPWVWVFEYERISKEEAGESDESMACQRNG